MFLLILTLFRMLKIAGRVILKIRNSSATAILLMSRTMKIRKLKLFYCQKNTRYRAKELWRDIFLGNLSLKEGKNSVGLPVLILEFWWRHVQTKNRFKAGFHWRRSRSGSRSRKSASDLVKIENQSRKRSHKLDGTGVGRIRTVPFSSDSAYDSDAYDPMKTGLSES